MKQMTVTEFKTWFAGLTAGIAEGGILNSHQVKALREAIEGLFNPNDVMPKENTGDGNTGGSTPVQNPVPSFPENDSTLDKFRKQDGLYPWITPYDDRYWLDVDREINDLVRNEQMAELRRFFGRH